jgi:hypothetical protein
MMLSDGGHWLAVKGALGCKEGRTLFASEEQLCSN